MSDMRLSGLASGIDTTSLIQQLMKVERRPIDLLQNNIGKNNKVLEALRNLNTKFQALEAAAKKVQELSNFAPNANATTGSSGSSTTETLATVASPGLMGVGALPAGATLGEYRVNIQRVAQRAVFTTGGIDLSAGGVVGGLTNTDKIRFTRGDGVTHDVTMPTGSLTLQAIASKINADSAAPMTASVGNNRLIFEAKNVGAAFNYSLSVYDSNNAYDAAATQAMAFEGPSTNGLTTYLAGTDASISVTPPGGVATTYTNTSSPLQTASTVTQTSALGGAAGQNIYDLTVNGVTASVTFVNETLSSAATKLNATGLVTASVSGSQLTITSNTPGAAGNFTFTLTSTNSIVDPVNGSPSAWNLQNLGLSSVVTATFNSSAPSSPPGTATITAGSNLKSSANTFSASDLTLFAHATGETSFTIAERAISGSTNVTVNTGDDTNTTIGVIRDLFNKYNDVVKQLRADTAYNPSTRTGGPLMGDPSVGRLMNELNRALTLPFTQNTATTYPGTDSGLDLPGAGGPSVNDNRGFKSYVNVGLRVEKDGTVSVDESVLRAALTSNPNDVRRLFAFEDYALQGSRQVWQGGSSSTWGDGIATRLRAFANQSSSPLSLYNGILPNGLRAEGAILSRISAVDRQNATFNENIQRQERRMVQRERLLRLQFQNMEKVLSGLKSQGSYLQGQFANAGQ